MSGSEDSTVTYTEVSSLFEDLSDIGSPRVDGLPMMLEEPYVEAALQAFPSPDDMQMDVYFQLEEHATAAAVPHLLMIHQEEHPALRPADSVPPLSPLLQIEDSSPPLPVSSPPLPASHTYPLGYRAVMIRDSVAIDEVGAAWPHHTTTSYTSFRGLLPSRGGHHHQGHTPTSTYSIHLTLLTLLLPFTDYKAGFLRLTWGMSGWDFARGTPVETIVARLSQRMTDFVTISMDASDTARFEVRALRTTVPAQQTKIAGLRVADRTRQTQLVETLTLMRTLQTQVTTLQSQQGPASGPAQPEIPEEAGSSS
ncbi:hypothetical protein Tco_0764772 [Tanacetum coccineum]